jgi:Amt family ammonium transporter
METAYQFIDVAWLLVCAALVMLMQAGFSCLESGMVRSKNSINVAAKNFADFCLSSAMFWLFGFAVMFGVTYGGIFGTSGFFFGEAATPWLLAFFIFQMGFCGTATTIVSGAVAERMRFGGYLVVASILSGLIYPLVGHWVWGSAAGVKPGGWLEQMGFIDFAGGTVVHSVGGWMSLAAIIVIGPRIGRFGKDRAPIQGHDIPFATLGVFLLWFGWFGFNGGSTLGLTPDVPKIIVNTVISGAFGGLIAMALAWRLSGQPDVTMIMNGSLAGLVGITASANIMTPVAAVAIGCIAAVVMYGATMLLERLELDDVVGAVPVHLAAGIWGTLAVAIFADPQSWGSGLGRWDQFVVQATGVVATFVWAFGVGFTLLWLINRRFPLRIDPRGERIGLNVAEHGASTEILDLLNAMDNQRRTNDFSQPVSVEPHTEIGQIARQYNHVLADINEEHRKLEATTEALRLQTDSLQLLQGTATAANQAKSFEDVVRTCLESICAFGGWSIGHCFMTDGRGEKLISSGIWHLDDEESYAVFREATDKTYLGLTSGFATQVWASGEPTWSADVSKEKDFFRARAAEDVGIKGAAAFPVLIGDEVVAVLEFFSPEPLEPNEAVLEVMASVGTQLGRVVERTRSAEARFKTMVDNMPANVHLRNKDGRFIIVNRKYEEFYGVANDFVQGKTLHEINGNSVFDQVFEGSAAADLEVIEKNIVIEREFKVMDEDGTRTVTDRLFPITDSSGEVVEVGGVEIDITDLKRTEEALRENEERFRDFSEAASDWFWEMDENLCFTYFSGRFAEISGIANEDLIGKTRQKSSLEQENDSIRRNVADLEAHRSFKDFEHSRTLANGDIVYMSTMGKPVFDADGNFKGYRGTGRDITKRKRAEEVLQEAHEIIKCQKERMEDELNIGREIQMSMIPLEFPPFPDHDEFSIFATLKPAREVGGDFYDFYFLDEERLCICIGDVSGKGVPSALFMAMAKTLIKSKAVDDASTASILTHVNDELSADNKTCMFVTIFAGILNIRTGELIYTNAGHSPPYLRRQDGHWQRLDQRHGPVIGAVEGLVYKEEKDRMEPGDLLFLYSDGVTEAMDAKKRLFSEDRLKELLHAGNTDDAVAVVDNTLAAVRAFEGGTEQSDDITVLGLEFHGGSEEAPVAKQRIVIKNHLPEIAGVIETFGAFAEKFGIPAPVSSKFKLIFDDLLNNVISYAYGDDNEHDIEVRMDLAGERLTVTVTDDGMPFNPLIMESPDTGLSLEDRDAGGLGVLLIRSLVDDVSYQRRIDKNIMTMVKHL